MDPDAPVIVFVQDKPHRYMSCDERCWGECWDDVHRDEEDIEFLMEED